MTSPVLRDVLVVSCAVSGGLHAGLVPSHHGESPALGFSFAVAAAVLAAIVLVLVLSPESAVGPAAAALVLAGLLAAYALAATAGLPFLHPEPEPVDGIAVATKAVEAAGLMAALALFLNSAPINRTKGQLT